MVACSLGHGDALMSDDLPEGVVILPDPEPCEHAEYIIDNNGIKRCADPECRQRLVEVDEPGLELPGMWEESDFDGPDTVRGSGESEWPLFSVDTETGHTTVDWGPDRPEVAMITPDSIDQILAARNQMIDQVGDLEKQVAQGRERIENLLTVLAIVKLGRRPSQKDWESIGLSPMPRQVYLDVMRRKPQT